MGNKRFRCCCNLVSFDNNGIGALWKVTQYIKINPIGEDPGDLSTWSKFEYYTTSFNATIRGYGRIGEWPLVDLQGTVFDILGIPGVTPTVTGAPFIGYEDFYSIRLGLSVI